MFFSKVFIVKYLKKTNTLKKGDKMEKKNIGILVLVLVLVAVSIVLTDNKDAGTKVVTLAIAEQKVYVEGYNKLDIMSNGEKFILTTNKVGADRKSADFTFMSATGEIRSDFSLNLLGTRTITKFRDPKEETLPAAKSKTIIISETEKFYIELISADKGKALIVIKSLQR